MIEYVEVDDGRFVAFRVRGEGPLNILHLAGFPASIDVFDDEPHVARYCRRLAGIGRLIEFDLPGLGLSDGTDDFDLDDLAQTVLAVIHAAGAADVVVVAQSTAPIAIHLAATRPDVVRAVVLINATARITRADDYRIGLPEAVVREFIDATSLPSGDWVVQDLDRHSIVAPSRATDQRYRDFWERAMRQYASPAANRRLREFLSHADVRASLDRIKAPTLVIARKDDAFVPAVHGRYLADHIAGAKYVELPGADHAPYAGDADALVDEVEEFLLGERRGSPDRLLTTIMFTDLVDSTQSAAAMSDSEWRVLLDTHDAAIRQTINRFGGRIINTTGDGFLAVFDLPTRALACGAALTDVGFPLRIGIHAGECERRGNDIAGLAVHVAARIAKIGAPGQVSVSRTVCDLVNGIDLTFADRGEHELRGVPGRWRILALVSAESSSPDA